MGMPNKIELIYGKSIDKTKILCYTIYVKVKKDYYFKPLLISRAAVKIGV